ncbi:MAG: FG-GAP repeat domain-containing protein, partial [Aestuariivirgaceae bacterium]
TRKEARHFGIDKPMEFSFHDIWPPFWNGRSISTGDIDNDGDPDIVFASSERGLYIYFNDGTGKFERKDFGFEKVTKLVMLNAALVDLNNDGWLDLFLSAYRQGSHVLWNNKGSFDEADLTPVKNRDDGIVPIGLSFADIDRDGFLDAALGNWSAGWYRRIPGEEARNRIVFNDDGKMTGNKYTELEGMPGESLSLLVSDFNMDGFADVMVGNDFEQPDVFYLGDGKGGMKRVRPADGLIEQSTQTTMAVKTADFDNDLVPEIYVAQIAGRASGASERLKLRPIQLYCSDIERPEDQEYCLKNLDIHGWYKSGNQFDPALATKCLKLKPRKREECKGMMVKDLAIQNDDASICSYIKPDQVRAQQYCDIHFRPKYQPTEAEYADNIPQIPMRNVLLANDGSGSFKDVTEAKGLGVGGWSWDVKTGDFDNDEWQDVYIVNGTWVAQEFSPSNLFYSNQGGKAFKEATEKFGLLDYLLTPVATQFDMDNDGDLDMITYTTNGPIMTFVNNSQKGNTIAFEFR